ncbi:MAG: hypothetical protein ACFFED_06765 [Candidatus Thorarchaeota archaeon]
MPEISCMKGVRFAFVGLLIVLQLSVPISTALVLHVENQTTLNTPIREPDAPQWTEVPQNVTLEYGSRFSMTVNITGTAAAWAISDEQNFKITWHWGSTFASIKDTHILEIGVYFLRIYVWDEEYNGRTADIWITVVDSHFPSIDGPGNIEFVQGSNRTRTFTWHASDANPISYLITLNGGLVDQGEWNDEQKDFIINIGHLREGTYTYELELQDIGGNIASNIVSVHVLSDGNDPIKPSNDYLVNRNAERYVYIDPPNVLFIEIFAIFVLSGLVGLVMVSAVAGKAHEFGFN